MTRLPWDDDRLFPKSDNPEVRRYRRLQSWYRDQVLNADYGTYVVRGNDRPLGNLLAAHEVDLDPSLNFVSPSVGAYADRRVPIVTAEGGSLEEDRLRRNLLSSMPMCFNIFAALANRPAFADLLGEAFGIDIAVLERVECEWTPVGAGLGDRTAFDAFVSFLESDGSRAFLAVETKYTETFSPREYMRPTYQAVTDSLDWFNPGAAERLSRSATNQLWRNSMLAAVTLEEDGWDRGYIGVLRLEDDPGADAALTGVRDDMKFKELLVDSSLERLVAIASDDPALSDWADVFGQRYVDLSAVEGTGPMSSTAHDRPSQRPTEQRTPSRPEIEVLSWNLAAEVVALRPDRLHIVETHPCGGFYDCLTIVDRRQPESPIIAQLNREGSITVWADVAGEQSLTSGTTWSDLAAGFESTHLAEMIIEASGLGVAVDPSDADPALLLSYQFVAAILHRLFATQRDWRCVLASDVEHSREESPVYADDADWLLHVPQSWRLERDGEVALRIDASSAIVSISDGADHDLRRLGFGESRLEHTVELIVDGLAT